MLSGRTSVYIDAVKSGEAQTTEAPPPGTAGSQATQAQKPADGDKQVTSGSGESSGQRLQEESEEQAVNATSALLRRVNPTYHPS